MYRRGTGSDKRRARQLHREAIRLGFEISFMDLWTRLDFWEQKIYDTKMALYRHGQENPS